MSWTKRQIIAQAFEEIGLASYVYDLTAEQVASAARKLDAMMGAWAAAGLRLSWALPSDPDAGDLDEQTGLPDYAVEAVYCGLAIRLAGAYGKQSPPDLKQTADAAYNSAAKMCAEPTIERSLGCALPAGAGAKSGPVYLPGPTDEVLAGGDGPIILE